MEGDGRALLVRALSHDEEKEPQQAAGVPPKAAPGLPSAASVAGGATGWRIEDIPDNLEERAAALDAMLEGGYPERHEIMGGPGYGPWGAGLYLGTQGSAGVGTPGADLVLIQQGLAADGITAIVNCTGDDKAFPEKGLRYACAMLPHKPAKSGTEGWADFSVAVRELVAFVCEVLDQGGGVLVHCNNGQNRSAAIVTACLMRRGRMGLRDAYLLVREKRSIVNTKLGEALAQYEEELQREGVLR